jgi:hypothetical protein
MAMMLIIKKSTLNKEMMIIMIMIMIMKIMTHATRDTINTAIIAT